MKLTEKVNSQINESNGTRRVSVRAEVDIQQWATHELEGSFDIKFDYKKAKKDIDAKYKKAKSNVKRKDFDDDSEYNQELDDIKKEYQEMYTDLKQEFENIDGQDIFVSSAGDIRLDLPSELEKYVSVRVDHLDQIGSWDKSDGETTESGRGRMSTSIEVK